jgi:hypothetical protein
MVLTEPYEMKADTRPLVHNLKPSKIQDRYRPLQFPHVLHDFPMNHYKYLPRFDGELDKISVEKHIEAFDHFIDLLALEVTFRLR